MRKNLLCIPILVVLLVGLTVTRVNATSTPVVSVDPPISFGVAGATVTINVTVTNVTELYCYQGNLTFDPAILNCTSVEEGPFLGTAGDTWWLDPVIDNYNGWVLFGNSLYAPPLANGNGTLAVFTFNVIAEGRTPLNFSGTVLGTLDENWVEIDIEPIEVEGGVFTIPGDIDGDGDVDPDDFVTFGGAYGTKEGEPAYNPMADLDRDGDVDPDDFVTFGGKYGMSV